MENNFFSLWHLGIQVIKNKKFVTLRDEIQNWEPLVTTENAVIRCEATFSYLSYTHIRAYTKAGLFELRGHIGMVGWEVFGIEKVGIATWFLMKLLP